MGRTARLLEMLRVTALPLAVALLPMAALSMDAAAQWVPPGMPETMAADSLREPRLTRAPTAWIPTAVNSQAELAAQELDDLERRRSPWTYPLVGAMLGAAAGVVAGYAMMSGGDWIGPPPFIVTVPLGATVGALLGVVANAIDPPRGR